MSNTGTIVSVLICALMTAAGLSFSQNSKAKLKFPIAVTVSFPHHEYTQIAASIKGVDFRNFDYRLDGERIRLRNGLMRASYSGGGGTEIKLERVSYFDFHNGAPIHAVLTLDDFSFGGSSSDDGVLLVFGVIDRHLVLEQQLEYDRQSPRTGNAFDKKTGRLTISARASDDSAHCCPENVETDEFKWDGEKFKLMHRRIDALPPGSPRG